MDHFIETVRKYPCLWNTTAIEYRDQELKDAAWAEVMKDTDLSSVKEVKLKWKKLRDSYRDALKRQSEMLSREPSSQSKKNYPWKYTGQMQFLQPYMSNRRKAAERAVTSRNGHAGPSTGGGGARASDDSDSESESDRAPPPAKLRRVLIDRKLEYLSQQRDSRRRASAPAPPPPEPPPPPPCEPAAAAATTVLAVHPPDPLDIFFNSMCQSTKRFPFQTQIKIKRSLFEAVMEAEEALVAQQQSLAGLWTRAARAGAASSSAPSSEPDVKPC